MSEKESLVEVFGGVDTHRDCHVAAVVDTAGRVLGTAPFPADAAGFEELGGWLRSQGRVVRVGVEGTGSYGAGLTRYLTGIGIEVVEVNRPNRQLRRRLGKTDTTDAQAGLSNRLCEGVSSYVKLGAVFGGWRWVQMRSEIRRLRTRIASLWVFPRVMSFW